MNSRLFGAGTVELAVLACCLTSPALAQQPQNPSPMVEHTRAHPRLTKESPPGRRIPLTLGTLFLPEKLNRDGKVPLFIHFHGATWLAEVAAAARGTAAIAVQLGAGSAV